MRALKRRQDDLFDPLPAYEQDADDELLVVSCTAEPIAIPCGFMTNSNQRCRRLATKPVMIEGRQLTCRGRPMLHCHPACFSAPAGVDAVDKADRVVEA